MTETDKRRVLDLMGRLEKLEAERPPPELSAIQEVAQQAIVDEISRLLRGDCLLSHRLSVYRNGGNFDAVSLA